MKRILILFMTAVLLCASAVVLSSCNDKDGDDAVHTHTMGEWTVTVEADCVHDGQETRTCTADDCSYSETRTTTPALGHDLKNVAALEPNCIEPGHNAYKKCTRCVYNTYVEIPANGHDYTLDDELNPNGNTCIVCKQVHVCNTFEEWQIEEEADCTIAGTKTHKCTVCNATETESIPMVDHNFGEDDICTECGKNKNDDAIDLPDHELD